MRLASSASGRTADWSSRSHPQLAPATAAQNGSSMAGEQGAKNEMKAHKDDEKAQNTMDDPHKQSQ